MQLVLQYTRYVAVLKWLTLSLFAYLGVVVFAHVSWEELAWRWPCRASTAAGRA